MAHLHLGLLAYWIVNTVRYQLKRGQEKETAEKKVAEKTQEPQSDDKQDIPINYNSQWTEIVRIMNTHKTVTTVSQNRYDEFIISHRCSDPTPKVEAIYQRMKYKSKPNTNRKFVVHKSDFINMNNVDIYLFPT